MLLLRSVSGMFLRGSIIQCQSDFGEMRAPCSISRFGVCRTGAAGWDVLLDGAVRDTSKAIQMNPQGPFPVQK